MFLVPNEKSVLNHDNVQKWKLKLYQSLKVFRTVLQTKCKLINFFAFKIRIPAFLHSGMVYKFECGGYNVTFYSKTKRHFKVRMCEKLGISALTGKRKKGDKNSAIKVHHFFCNHSSGFDNFSILASNNNDFNVTLMASL